ncbi:siderophore-iron reductase FhuF [Vreelandella sulfidaeris]|uniref:siderophore-iron reductase FhuF n=1 Tax=Vreelandella sulfidaeris TaxID=115553 RepID=UPI0035EE3318
MPLALRQPPLFKPSLAACYTGPLANFTPPLIGGIAPLEAFKTARWRDADWLKQDLARFSSQYPNGDTRAVVSLWSKWHFSVVTIPTLTANLLLDKDLPIGLDDTQVIFNEKGATERLWLPNEGVVLTTDDPFERFSTLIDQHWAPLIEQLGVISKAAQRVFWSNAGGYFDYYVNALGEHPLANQQAVDSAKALLEARSLPNGKRNPLFQPVRYFTPTGNEDVKRVRKLCCLRYLLDEFDTCGTCPLDGCDLQARKRAKQVAN